MNMSVWMECVLGMHVLMGLCEYVCVLDLSLDMAVRQHMGTDRKP